MLDKIFVRNILIFTLVLSFCIGVLGYVLVEGNRQIRSADGWISHTHKIILKSGELSALVEGMLASQRGYMITGNDEFVKNFETQKAAISENIAALSEMTSDNESQASRLDEIRSQFSEMTLRMEERAKEYRPIKVKEDVVGETEIVTGIKDDILRLNSALLTEEQKLLGTRMVILEKRKREYFVTLVSGCIIAAIILVIFNFFLFHAQARRSVAERSLRDTEKRFALAIDGANDGIFDWNITTGQVFYSQQFFRILGYSRDSFVGNVEDFEALLHPDDAPKVWQYVERYLSGELSEYSNTFRMKGEHGRWVWINSRAKAIFDREGKPVRMVGAHTDITYMKEYQEKLKEEKTTAEKASRAKSDFLAHMSHEIRTPLTAISGIAEIMQGNNTNLTDKQKHLIKTLHSSTSTLKDLVNDILDFSKIESGELELEHEVFDLPEIFQQVISIMSVQSRDKGLEFSFDYEGVKDLRFYGDRLRLRQIMINLIGNAIKFTEKGSVKVRATQEQDEGNSYMRIEVADSGIGIAQESFDLVFERFKQADSSVSRKYGGTGLGLPITKNLVDLMGGSIKLKSVMGEGSTFSVLLPVLEASQNPMLYSGRTRERRLKEKIRSISGASNRILLVEDYEGNVVVLSFILDDLGCGYDIARTGLEALNLWKDNTYDMVLMDIQMPEMDGITATRHIRSMEEEKGMQRTPIIGMTAHALVGDRDKCLAAGMDGYLPKPIVEIDLKEQIFRYLGSGGRKVA